MSDQTPLTLICPLCKEEHAYRLTVQRSTVLGSARRDTGLPIQQRTFVQLFTCPTRSQRFQAELTLPETALTRIRSLEVSDPSDG